MAFTNFTDLKNINDTDLLKSVDSAKKELFELRLKKATRQSFKPHLFKHTKRKIAQLLTVQSERLKLKKES